MYDLENPILGNTILDPSLEVDVMLLLATNIFAQYYSICFINSFWMGGGFQQILGGKKHENDCLVSFMLQKYLVFSIILCLSINSWYLLKYNLKIWTYETVAVVLNLP